MLDPKRIRSDKNYITKNFARRGVKVNLDEVIELDANEGSFNLSWMIYVLKKTGSPKRLV